MTGEMSLRGKVLPIGGLKEKLIAARRAGLKTILIPEANKNALEEVPNEIKDPLKIHLVKTIDDVLAIVFNNGVKKTKTKKPFNKVEFLPLLVDSDSTKSNEGSMAMY
jgi:ATP-dependent Lon protease